jgi:CRP-like cAMP-binding protein
MHIKPCTCHSAVARPYTGAAAEHPPTENLLLAALPAAEYQLLLPHLELVELTLGCSMYESGECMAHVFFPTTAIVALQYVMADGASAETALTGNRDVIGIAAFMGGESTSGRAVTVSPGQAYRLRTRILHREFARGGSLQHLLLRYTLALFTQMALTAVCNRHHSVDQQLCRWLLLSQDCLPSSKIHMTQELIAQMLGVRRESVTEAATRLRDAGLLDYRRGSITVLDRPGLELRACECYAVVKREIGRLLSWKPPADAVQGLRFVQAS